MFDVTQFAGALQLFRDYLSGKRYLNREKDWILPDPSDWATMDMSMQTLAIAQGIQALGIRSAEDRLLMDAADTLKTGLSFLSSVLNGGGMANGGGSAPAPASGQLGSGGGSVYKEGGKSYFVGLPPAGSVRGFNWDGKQYVGAAPTRENSPVLYGQGALNGYTYNWDRNAWETVG